MKKKSKNKAKIENTSYYYYHYYIDKMSFLLVFHLFIISNLNALFYTQKEKSIYRLVYVCVVVVVVVGLVHN